MINRLFGFRISLKISHLLDLDGEAFAAADRSFRRRQIDTLCYIRRNT